MDTIRFLVFYQSLHEIIKNIKKIETSYMKEYGLRSVHMVYLLRIHGSEKGSTVTELAALAKTDKALTSRTVKELIDSGFVTSRTKSEDRSYRKKYHLTPKGEEVASAINSDILDYILGARADISEEDIQIFYRVLATFENNISLIANKEKG